MDHAFSDVYKRTLLIQSHEHFKSFMVLHFIKRTLHFECVSVAWGMGGSSCCAGPPSCCDATRWEGSPLSELPFQLCQKSRTTCVWLWGRTSSLLHWSTCLPFNQLLHWFNSCCFTVASWDKVVCTSLFFLLNHFLLSTLYLQILLDLQEY